jgi:hypothetical protein
MKTSSGPKTSSDCALGGTAIAIRFDGVPAFIAFLNTRRDWRGLNQDGSWPEFAELWPDPSDH